MESPQGLTESIDAQLMPRLPPGVVARFEAVSGLLILSVTSAELSSAASHLQSADEVSRKLFAAINHEMYHYFQVISSGYHFLHVAEMGEIAMLAAARIAAAQEQALGTFPQQDASPSESLEDALLWERRTGWQQLIVERNYLAQLQDRALPGQQSLAVAQEPELMDAIERHYVELRACNSAGVSALDLIEGSALVYQYALTYADSTWEERMSAEWSQWDVSYQRAFDIAKDRCGMRARDVFLPAVALALRYEAPAEAYTDLLETLAAAPAGGEIAAARALAEQPPDIKPAGHFLGTAADVRRRRVAERQWDRYDSILDQVSQRAWGVDEFDLLTVPASSGSVPGFPFGVVAADGPLTGPSPDTDLPEQIRLSSIMLRTASLPRAQRDLDVRLGEHILAGRHLWFYPWTSPAGQAFYDGVRCQERGDDAGARAAFEAALDAEEPDLAARAAANLGIVLMHHDASGARQALERAARSGDREAAPQAAFNLGVLLAQGGDAAGAAAAYRMAVASGHAEQAPKAADNLGILLYDDGDVGAARVAFQHAIDSGHHYFAPSALLHLGIMLEKEGDHDAAQAAWLRAIKSRHPDVAPTAGLNLGVLLAKHGDLPGASSVLWKAVRSGHAEVAPKAAYVLAELLEQNGDVDVARLAFQFVRDSGHELMAPMAVRRLESLG
jgi:tetratricopeptide (TPR) repeat protein